jgi:hypothetical protein
MSLVHEVVARFRQAPREAAARELFVDKNETIRNMMP